MNFAVVRTGGKQYLVSPGQKIKIERLEEKEGSEIIFRDVLLFGQDKKIEIGQPTVKDAGVSARVMKEGRTPKMIVFKYKPKKRYRKKKGHRQSYTQIEILEVRLGSKAVAKKNTTDTSDKKITPRKTTKVV